MPPVEIRPSTPPAPAERPNPSDAPSPGWRLTLALLRRLPQGAISRAVGWIAERRIPRPLRGPVIGGFARATGIDVGEAAAPPAAHASIAAFFARGLRPGARSWPDEPAAAASPVDGVVGALGRFTDGTLIQAKGLRYGVDELLAAEGAAGADGGVPRSGFFVTLYLSPRHYHRIHAPVRGGIVAARAVPGALLPVNPPAVSSVPRLFPRNERLVARLAWDAGGEGRGLPVWLVAVGAFNVGRISAAFDAAWKPPRGATNRGAPAPMRRTYRPPIPVERGDELMTFHLGSTVVLLFGDEAVGDETAGDDGPGTAASGTAGPGGAAPGGGTKGRWAPHPDLVPGAEVRLGAPLFVAGSVPHAAEAGG